MTPIAGKPVGRSLPSLCVHDHHGVIKPPKVTGLEEIGEPWGSVQSG